MKNFYRNLYVIVCLICAISLAHAQSLNGIAENDGFPLIAPTDRWYTNGFSLQAAFGFGFDPVSSLLNDFGFGNSDSIYIFEAAQNMYTPAIINPSAYPGMPNPNYDDRPYAGWSRVGMSVYTAFKDKAWLGGFSVGALGEAGAGFVQTLVHEIINYNNPDPIPVPEGWANHIKERLAIQLAVSQQRDIVSCYIPDDKGEKTTNKWFHIRQCTSLELGNVFDRGAISWSVRAGYFSKDRMYDAGLLIPSDDEDVKENLAEFSLFVEPRLNMIAYNGTLDHQVDPNYHITSIPLVAELSLGATLLLLGSGIEVRVFNWRTPDFAINNHFAFDPFKMSSIQAFGHIQVKLSWDTIKIIQGWIDDNKEKAKLKKAAADMST